MKDAELKYRIIQHLIDEPMDEYHITTLGSAIGSDSRRILGAIAELIRDGFLEQSGDPSGDFRLCVRRRPSATTDLRSRSARGEMGSS